MNIILNFIFHFKYTFHISKFIITMLAFYIKFQVASLNRPSFTKSSDSFSNCLQFKKILRAHPLSLLSNTQLTSSYPFTQYCLYTVHVAC